MNVFQLVSPLKVNLVGKMKRITRQAQKKLPILGVFTRFLIFGKIQDGDHVW